MYKTRRQSQDYSQNQDQSQGSSSKITVPHFVIAFSKEQEIVNGVENWVTNLRTLYNKLYQDLKTSEVKAIPIDSVLYVHAHGLSPIGQENRELEQSIQQNVTKDTWIGAKEFADIIENKWQLNKNHQRLKIAACYTDVFARDLCKALAIRGYNNLTVRGYKGELVLNGGRKLAGLEHEPAEPSRPKLFYNLYETDLTPFQRTQFSHAIIFPSYSTGDK